MSGVVVVVVVAAFDDIPQQQMKTLFNFEAIQEGDLSFKEGEKLLVTIEYACLTALQLQQHNESRSLNFPMD